MNTSLNDVIVLTPIYPICYIPFPDVNTDLYAQIGNLNVLKAIDSSFRLDRGNVILENITRYHIILKICLISFMMFRIIFPHISIVPKDSLTYIACAVIPIVEFACNSIRPRIASRPSVTTRTCACICVIALCQIFVWIDFWPLNLLIIMHIAIVLSQPEQFVSITVKRIHSLLAMRHTIETRSET